MTGKRHRIQVAREGLWGVRLDRTRLDGDTHGHG
jgi:hypothetical protein